MRRPKNTMSKAVALALAVGLLPTTLAPAAAHHGGDHAPVGQGFNLNASDLRFMLKQIKIAEQHSDTLTASDPCGTMRGPGADQIPVGEVGDTLPWGLRLVDGTCNNIVPGRATLGAADQTFPRLVPKSLQSAETGDPDGPGPQTGPVATSYTQTSGTVIDSQPRVISNLIVDQNATNPAAVEAAGELPEVTPTGSFVIPNTAPDVGLSAPFNSWFTLFGQFFDHGLDLVTKSSARGTVFVPLKSDDPLYSTAPNALNFMTLTRAQHPNNHEAINQTTPWVDQSQTYSSHPSHQVFLRKYEVGDHDFSAATPNRVVATGALLTGPGGGMATWADVKRQARELLGIDLTDADALNVPLLATDPYGRFLRGPNGLPQLVVPGATGGLVEGNPGAPVATTNATRSGHAFLDDIAHTAVPKPGFTADPDTAVTPGLVPCERPNLPQGCVNQYDNELLDTHFIAGDGRVNENIGLTAVHHVFHSEHNGLVGDIRRMIEGTDASRTGALLTAAEEADWKSTTRYLARDGSWDYGERLFQAARFVTEMQYQHLAFEEFIRKVQPMVAPFGEGGTGYNTSINPAIKAEFAHAVYRFGHSMLNESVDRVRSNGTRDDIDLFDAFLNPPEFMAGNRTPDQAAGDIVRGMTRQVGNEIDEFVTDALRDQLLGLPLDLATLNIARARDTGIPTLNAARRSFFARSNNSALAPYQSWADFAFALRHPKSLNNFIAAYGTHPTIRDAGTLADKRTAANRILEGAAGADGILADDPNTPANESEDNGPADSYAFLNSAPHEVTDPETGNTTVAHTTWVDPANTTNTGVDRIDLWAGGLAEKQFVFGGLLGPTFNYVFEQQMEDLQFGDRFYYLTRTAGLNMLTQLEGNSFAELIQRNTDASGLPADSFSRPALIFNINAAGTGVLDDPDTATNESTLVTRMADGTLRYGGDQHVVFNGTAGNNRVYSNDGDDTIRGNDGDDRMQGADGNDNLIGGLGDDILLDTSGDDVLKGGDGHDTLSSGSGAGGDLNQGGRGNDFIDHDDLAEAFAGPGDDYVLGGPEDDTVFGDDGDDWIESGATVDGFGGGAFNLLQGDNGAPFQDDPNEPGHDVLIGYGGETDNDAEGGDDVMLLGPGIQRNEGMLGFDYATHDGDLVGADSDMALTGLLPPSVETNKDRFDLVETLSGWNLNDTLRGDDRDAVAMEGHELTAAGTARVAGLSTVLGGATTFTGGNILLGGGGTDLIEGRGGNDIIDGDAQLNVRISVRSGLTEPTTELDSVQTLYEVSERLIAGTVNPGQLRIVREIQTPANGNALDTAQFSGPRADYDITFGATATTVAHTRGTALDGTDTLRNVERLRFTDQEIANAAPVNPAPTLATSVPAGNATGVAVANNVTVTFSEPVNGVNATTFTLTNTATNTAVPAVVTQNGTTNEWILNPNANLANNTVYRVNLLAGISDAGGAALAPTSFTFTTVAAANPAPTVTAQAPAVNATAVPVANNITATFSEPVNGVSGTTFTLRNNVTNALVGAVVSRNGTTNQWILNPSANLADNTVYRVNLLAGITDAGGAALAPTSWTFTTAAAANPAPTVTARAPAINATGAGITGNVTATFSEAVNGVSGTTFTLRNTVTGVAVPAVVTRNGTTNQWILNPNANLAADTRYTATLTGGAAAIRDLAGAALATTSWTFTTGPAPTITARTPAVNATAVAAANNITATFSEAVNGVSATTFQLRNATTGALIPAVVSRNGTTNQWILNPNANLANDTRYTATLTGGTAAVRDLGGNPLATSTWSFTTGPAPTVTGQTPAANAGGVGRAANVTATFSEGVTGVSATTFQLRNVTTNALITAVVSRNGTTNQWILNPSVTLGASTQYRVTLTGGTAAIRDTAGNPLATTTWTYTTGTA